MGCGSRDDKRRKERNKNKLMENFEKQSKVSKREKLELR